MMTRRITATMITITHTYHSKKAKLKNRKGMSTSDNTLFLL
jgi:hypothetical protein